MCPPPQSSPVNKQGSAQQDKKPANPSGNGRRVGERTNEAWAEQEAGFYYAVAAALLKTGFSEDEIGKIGGGNYCRMFEKATSAH